MRRRVVFLGLLCALLAPRVATSTVVIPPSFDELVARAQTIFVGEVIDRRAVWEASPQGRSIVTHVTFKVEDVWKGSTGPITQLEFLGGTIDDVTLEIAGMPAFTAGQRDVLFLNGDVKSMSPLVGFMHGRLRVERVSGVDRVRAFDGRSLGSTTDVGQLRLFSLTSVTPMRLTDVAAAVRARLRRQP